MDSLTRVRRGRTSAGIRSAARSRSCTRRRRFLQGAMGAGQTGLARRGEARGGIKIIRRATSAGTQRRRRSATLLQRR